MLKFVGLMFLLFLFYTPHTCRTQLVPPGAPIIMATKDVLATTVAKVKSANVDAARTKANLEKLMSNLRNNATVIQTRINTIVNNVLTNFHARIDNLGVNDSDVTVKDCEIPISSVESAAGEILTDANSCVSTAIESIERGFNVTCFPIEYSLAKINSDQILAETCVAEYDKTEMGIWNAIVTALCVTQAKERILSEIKNSLSPKLDTEILHVLYIDAMTRLKMCHDRNRISSFISETDSVYVKITNCISN